jgi:preprotein translocase subunit SecB
MADQAVTNEPVFNIQRIYLKDASMEQPNSPQIFLEQDSPAVDINLGIEQTQLGEGVFEVALTGTVTAKIAEKTLFLVECKQAGIFEVSGFPADQIGPILGVNCPQMLFPYLRAQISDIVVRGGFPPVVLNEINFPAIYAAQLEQQAQGTPTPN